MNRFVKNALITLLVAAFWWGVWEAAAAWVGASIIMVSPRVAFARLFALGQTPDFWQAVWSSMGRILLGFGLAMAGGALVAVGSASSRVVHRVFSPAVNVMNAMPLASFVLLVLFMFRRENLSLVVSFVMVLPVVYHNIYKGIHTTDAALLEMAAVFRVPFWKRALHIYWPAVAPFVFSAASVGIGFAWKSGISAELIGAARGTIGGYLHRAQVSIQTVDMYAWTIAIVAVSYAIDRGFSWGAKKWGAKYD